MANQNIREIPDENRLRILLSQGGEFVSLVQQTIELNNLPFTVEQVGDKFVLKDKLQGSALHLKQFITVDPTMMKRKEDVHALAKCEYPVLITGETGTGKEIIANALKGDRTGLTVFINCAGLPETLMESELFGYVKGSFTGAMGDRQGMLARAKGGLAFLDEISWLTLPMQAKLLRAIQNKTVRRVGGFEEEPIDCKIVCATNKSLDGLVKQGQFLPDLYARISTFEFNITPIRERMCDVEPIIRSMKMGEMFLNALRASGKNLHNLSFPHNVRSIEQYVRRFEVLRRID
jgi:two-component system response regulator PilR (NtrC family)